MSANSLWNEGRTSTRIKAQHEAQLLFISEVEPSSHGKHSVRFIGHTYDLSLSGLSLVADKVHVSELESCQPSTRMKLMLNISLSVIEIDV